MSEILTLAASGNAEKGINLINARMQAEALRRLRGYDCGVLENTFYTQSSPSGSSRNANNEFMWKLTATNVRDICVGRGMATAYGFDIQSEQDVHLSATPPGSGTAYIFVYLEWDFGSDPQIGYGRICVRNNGSSSIWTPTQQNLITNSSGIYQMKLYMLAVNSSGTITGTTAWASLGTTTIGNVLRSNYATNADSATTANNYNATSGTIKEKFDSVDQKLANLGFRKASISVSRSDYIDASSIEIYQLGKVLYGKFTAKIPANTTGPTTLTAATISAVNFTFSTSSCPDDQRLVYHRSSKEGPMSQTGYRYTTFTMQFNSATSLSIYVDDNADSRLDWNGTSNISVVFIFDGYQNRAFISYKF